MIVTLVGLLGVVACDDYDETRFNYVDKTTVSLEESTLHSLTFTWTDVADVANYKYALVKGDLTQSKDDALAQGTTTETSMVFTNLEPGATYTLWVTPVSSTGLVSRSFYGTFSTTAIVALETPTVTAEFDDDTYLATISWNEVEHASSYTYSYKIGDQSYSVDTNDLSFVLDCNGIPVGVYTIYVVANSDQEAYTTSVAGATVVTIGDVPVADRFVGNYTVYNEGYDCYTNYGNWITLSESHEAQITKVNNKSITLSNLFKGMAVTGNIDEDNQKIYFSAQKTSKGNWAIWGHDGSYDYTMNLAQIVATYDDSYNITIYAEDYGWAYGYDYSSYGDGYGWYPFYVGNAGIYRSAE